MGWTYSTRPQGKKQFVQQTLDECFRSTCRLLNHSLRGNNLWVLAQAQQPDGTPVGEPFIGLFLLACDKGCWGYKDMDESMGPCYYDCPLSFLERAPQPIYPHGSHLDSGLTWRDHVRQHHAAVAQRRKQRPKVGDRITLPASAFTSGAGDYLVTHDLGRRGLMLNGYVRLQARAIRYVQPALS